MSLNLLLAILALLGAGFAGHGAWILAAGRAGKRIARTYRSVGEAGRFRLAAGTGLVAATAAAWLHSEDHEVAGLTLLAVALALLALAVLRYRPRLDAARRGRGGA